MKWNSQAVYTFQSAIEPTGAELREYQSFESNIALVSKIRQQARSILNDGLSYGQRDQVITIDGVKQWRPPRIFPTLYELAAKRTEGGQKMKNLQQDTEHALSSWWARNLTMNQNSYYTWDIPQIGWLTVTKKGKNHIKCTPHMNTELHM